MLKGKWVLVTGATAGLGLAVAESLAGAGANIVLHDLVTGHTRLRRQRNDDRRTLHRGQVVEPVGSGCEFRGRQAVD